MAYGRKRLAAGAGAQRQVGGGGSYFFLDRYHMTEDFTNLMILLNDRLVAIQDEVKLDARDVSLTHSY